MATPPRVKAAIQKHNLKGVNKPKKTPKAKKAYVVMGKEGSSYKLVRFGMQGSRRNYSASGRKKFRARHGCDQKKSKLTASYWACWLWRKSSPKVKSSSPSAKREFAKQRKKRK